MSPHKVTELCLFVSVGLLHAAFLFFCAVVCVSKSVQCAYWVCSLHFCLLSMDRPNTEWHDTELTSSVCYTDQTSGWHRTPSMHYMTYWHSIEGSYQWPHSNQYVIRIIMVRHIHLVFLLISTESSSSVVLLSLCLVYKCSMWTVKAQQRSICYCFIRFVS